MFKFVFTRTPRPRQFYHKPIYWDPEEDERKEREERINGHKNADGEFQTSIKRGSFRRKTWDAPDDNSYMQAERRRSNIRLVVIALLLTAIGIALFLWI